jgi:hypothetical protein
MSLAIMNSSSWPNLKKAREHRWNHDRPHMRPIDKQLARAILVEVEAVFNTERTVVLSKNIKGNEPRYAAMELFPWSLETTAAYFDITVNSVSWAREQVNNWASVYPKLRAKVESVRAKLNLRKFPRHRSMMSQRSVNFLEFSMQFENHTGL